MLSQACSLQKWDPTNYGDAGAGSGGDGSSGGEDSAIGRTYVTYSGTVTATGATRYNWSIGSSSLPGGLTLQNTTGATVTIAGTSTEAGVFPLKLAVTDESKASTVDVRVAVTHKDAFRQTE